MNHTVQATVTASLSFDFRGQRFTPSIRVDLHAMVIKRQSVNHLYDLLGTSIGLDAYRHEYDVMVMHDIIFSEPAGLAREFVTNGKLDFDAFSKAWQQQQTLIAIGPIALKYLNIVDLDQHPDIRNALIESYQSGQENKQNRERVQSPP